MLPRERISHAIRTARNSGSAAIVGYLTAGFPEPSSFIELLNALGDSSDVLEIGVPFTDPMADGLTIQRSSRAALAKGVSLKWILEELTKARVKPKAPLLLMSYLNPLLAYGLDRLPSAAADAGIAGFVVPDLPYEESGEFTAALEHKGLALVQLVTPVTPIERLAMLCNASQGFVYAVTTTGTTGKKTAAVPPEMIDYMDRVKKVSPLPVCAGFGIRTQEQVRLLGPHVDGVVVASALIEMLERGEDPAAFLRTLRG